MDKKRVLVVDDEADFTRIVKLNLDRIQKYEVRVETAGDKALAAAREFKPDVILMDIIMPDVSGNELADQIQLDPELRDIPIVFVTAVLSREEAPKIGGNRIGKHRFLAKPVQLKELVDCIEHPLVA